MAFNSRADTGVDQADECEVHHNIYCSGQVNALAALEFPRCLVISKRVCQMPPHSAVSGAGRMH
ncbi:Hypothetical protein SMAX5B_004158 [Scophthalmus maximus]|uniref:Uncharacterized protein n=1 Tax=Scophthalmus maximus TaxID=52904 RepID=A0A2U9B855_SCOMX|nr:Hypothetical protein SMAX5B_004158 [Scophthalmus maximus]